MKRLLAGVAISALVACGGGYKGPKSGQVEKRIFDPMHVEEQWRSNCVSTIGPKGQVSTVCVPYQHTELIPDKWYLTISGCDDPADKKTCKRGSFEVTKEMYDSVELGMTVVYKDVRKAK